MKGRFLSQRGAEPAHARSLVAVVEGICRAAQWMILRDKARCHGKERRDE
jgi:hypothetical protein